MTELISVIYVTPWAYEVKDFMDIKVLQIVRYLINF